VGARPNEMRLGVGQPVRQPDNNRRTYSLPPMNALPRPAACRRRRLGSGRGVTRATGHVPATSPPWQARRDSPAPPSQVPGEVPPVRLPPRGRPAPRSLSAIGEPRDASVLSEDSAQQASTTFIARTGRNNAKFKVRRLSLELIPAICNAALKWKRLPLHQLRILAIADVPPLLK
jgi:hypothetical protein